MRQVTGSNSASSDNKVSIQLLLDGHSFSREVLPKNVAHYTTVEVELLTAKSLLVPEECFAPELAYKLLSLSGIACSDEELPVWSDAKDGVVALMLLHREVVEMLNECYGSRLKYTSPLLRGCEGMADGRYLYLYCADHVAYFKLYNGPQLDFCEAMTIAGVNDILCTTQRVAELFGCDELTVKVAGPASDDAIKLLKQYHKVEKCE